MRTWDCFTFNDELRMLEFRLLQLAPVVDRFVIVEADKTNRDQPKPLHFGENAERYRFWSEKIVRVVAALPGPPADNAERERVQRAAILEGLVDLEPDDLVLVGDVDEIPRPEVVARLKSQLVRPMRLTMRHCMYAANYRVPEDWKRGTKAGRGHHLGLDEFNILIGRVPQTGANPDREWFADAGWHLSFLGGPAVLQAKLRDYVHAEYDTRPFREADHLQRCIDYGVDLVGSMLLRPLSREEFDPLLRGYFEFAPDHFQLEPPPALPWRLAFRAWARFRSKLPYSLVRMLERKMRVTLLMVGLPLVLLDVGTRLARQHRLRHRLLVTLRLRDRSGLVLATPEG